MFPTEPVPEKIGAYKILRRLAGAGSTSVFLGRLDGPLGFKRVCELKLVPNTAEGDPRMADELAREASICATLNHPAIVRMFDFFEHDGKLVLVLEHVEGVHLERLLQHLASRQQKLADAAIYYLVHRIAGALAHAHAATDEHGSPTPVIHRNLHPENIVIGWDGQVRLTGFGIGKILGRTPDTIAGIVKGAPGYMAPEQVRAERVTTKADIYGLGLLLWSLLAGRRPPSDGTRPPAISTIRHEVPRPIVALLDTALAPLPDNRKITCQDIEQALSKVARPEKGKAELVTRVQSAHATIEIEDADPEEDRRPTIPVKKGGAATARPAGGGLAKLAKDLAGKDAGAAGAARAGAQARPGAPAPGAPDAAALDGGAKTAKPPAGEPSEAITIPVPAHEPPPRQAALRNGGEFRPALPDRETFGRLFEASKRAAERDAATAEDGVAPGMATLPEIEPPFEGGEDDATLPGSGVASVRFGPPPPIPGQIPEAILFGPPPALPADVSAALLGPPPSAPAAPGLPTPTAPSFGVSPPAAPGLPTPTAPSFGVSPPAPGRTPPAGMPRPPRLSPTPPGGISSGLPGLPATSVSGLSTETGAPPTRRRRLQSLFWQGLQRLQGARPGWQGWQGWQGWHGVRQGWQGWHGVRQGVWQGWQRIRQGWQGLSQGSRSLSPAGTIAVSALTATVVAVLWIYVARPAHPDVVVSDVARASSGEEASLLESIASAEASPARQPPPPKRPPAAKAPAKAPPAREPAPREAATREPAPREAATREPAPREAAPREAEAREPAPREAATREPAARSATASAPRTEPSLENLPKDHGLLTVGFPDQGGVYVNGKLVGAVNEPLSVRCGRWFVRTGKQGKTKVPEWLSAGTTVYVPCQGATRVEIKPTVTKARAAKR